MTDHWLDETTPYPDRDAPRCRSHPSELETNCRLCRSEAIANHDREPENIPAAEFRNRPKRQAARRAGHQALTPGETT